MNQNKFLLLLSVLAISLTVKANYNFKIFPAPNFPVKNSQSHPLLYFEETDYPALRAKKIDNPEFTGSDPFDIIRGYAKDRWNWGINDGNIGTSMYYNIVAYIEETDITKRRQYIDQILTAIDFWPEWIIKEKFGTNHATIVLIMSEYMMSVIALDMIHDYLTDAELKNAQEKLYNIALFYAKDERPGGGGSLGRPVVSSGVNVTFYAYLDKESEETAYWAEQYKQHVYNWLLPDNSWGQSPGYAEARMCADRLAKNLSLYMLTRLGIHDFTTDSKVLSAYEWMNSFMYTPMGGHTSFGDAVMPIPVNSYERSVNNTLIFFHSDDARCKQIAKNYVWKADWEKYPQVAGVATTYGLNNAIRYILEQPTLVKGEMPVSALYRNSGAALWDNSVQDHEAFQGILYSLYSGPGDKTTGHDHENANTICLSAYGQKMVANSAARYNTGYPGTTPSGDRWYDARWQNSVLLDNDTRHSNKDGGGLHDGLIGGNVEFGATSSGSAIKGAIHSRSLLLVKPHNALNGYFVLFDDVLVNNGASDVRFLTQMHSLYGTVETVSDKFSYKAPINAVVHEFTSDGNEKVNVFYGTLPDAVTEEESYKAYVADDKATANLEAHYSPIDGMVKTATVIFPEDATHSVPNITKLNETADYSGLKIAHNSTYSDVLLKPKNDGLHSVEGISYEGSGLYVRKKNDVATSYLAIRSKNLMLNDGLLGFSSSNNISVQIDDSTGHINLAGGAEVTFYYPEIRQLKLDGKLINVVNTDNGSIEVYLPSGRYPIEFMKVYSNPDTVINKPQNPTSTKQLEFINPTDGQRFVDKSGQIGITVEANDSMGIASVSMYLDNTLIRTETTAPYNWGADYEVPLADFTLLTSRLSDGDHKLKAVAINFLGEKDNAEITIKVGESSSINDFESSNLREVNVYPNPFNSTFIISYSSAFELNKVVVYNSLGQLVHTQNIVDHNSRELEITLPESVDKGIYLVQLLGKHEMETFRILKSD